MNSINYDYDADWAEGRNEADAADAAAATRREADSDDARTEALAIEAEQAEQARKLRGRHSGCRSQISDHGCGRKSIQFFSGDALVADYNI